MYKLFDGTEKLNSGVFTIPALNFVKEAYKAQVSKVVEYYRRNNKPVSNTHLLVRILGLSTPNVHSDLDTYVRLIYARAANISKHFRLTSNIEVGILHKDLFYRGSNIVFYTDEYFDIQLAIRDWENLVPVTVLRHPVSSLSLLLPEPTRYPTQEIGLSVVSVNLPMLLIQYRQFLLQQMNKPSGEREGSHSFIGRYVLPNMMHKHIDHCLYNRYRKVFYGNPRVDREAIKLPIYTIDYSKRIDEAFSSLVEYLQNRPMLYSRYLEHIPSAYSGSGLSLLTMLDEPRTRQNWWAMYLSRIDDMLMLIDLGGLPGVQMNGDLLARGRVEAERLIRDNVYSSKLDLELHVYSKLNRLLFVSRS